MVNEACPCKSDKRLKKYQMMEVVGYGKTELIYVDYRFPAIVKLRRYGEDDHNFIYDKDKLLIKFCPFCGRELKGGVRE